MIYCSSFMFQLQAHKNGFMLANQVSVLVDCLWVGTGGPDCGRAHAQSGV